MSLHKYVDLFHLQNSGQVSRRIPVDIGRLITQVENSIRQFLRIQPALSDRLRGRVGPCGEPQRLWVKGVVSYGVDAPGEGSAACQLLGSLP